MVMVCTVRLEAFDLKKNFELLPPEWPGSEVQKEGSARLIHDLNVIVLYSLTETLPCSLKRCERLRWPLV